MYYGENKYGQSNYAENIPSTEELIDNGYFVDLTKYVPTVVWKKSKVIQSTYKTQGIELGLLYYYLDDLKNLIENFDNEPFEEQKEKLQEKLKAKYGKRGTDD